jgi:hypothetical protein
MIIGLSFSSRYRCLLSAYLKRSRLSKWSSKAQRTTLVISGIGVTQFHSLPTPYIIGTGYLTPTIQRLCSWWKTGNQRRTTSILLKMTRF